MVLSRALRKVFEKKIRRRREGKGREGKEAAACGRGRDDIKRTMKKTGHERPPTAQAIITTNRALTRRV